jgi:GntR family transcriptional regulator
MEWNNKQPIYLQLKDKVSSQILDGKISEGEMIPSIRQVSMDYQLNPLTVSKAYQSLVDDGIIVKQRGLGMKVIEGAQQKLMEQQRQHFLELEWPQLKEKLQRLNINIKELLDE